MTKTHHDLPELARSTQAQATDRGREDIQDHELVSKISGSAAVKLAGGRVERRDRVERNLELARIVEAQAARDLDRAVMVARDAGLSWSDIATPLGLSIQAAHQRWSRRGLESHRRAQEAWRQRAKKND